MTDATPQTPKAKMSLPSLLLGLIILGVITVYPFIFADKMGKVDHWALMALMWAMSAGFVRGVGFVPENKALRWLLSSWAAFGAFIVAIVSFSL